MQLHYGDFLTLGFLVHKTLAFLMFLGTPSHFCGPGQNCDVIMECNTWTPFLSPRSSSSQTPRVLTLLVPDCWIESFRFSSLEVKTMLLDDQFEACMLALLDTSFSTLKVLQKRVKLKPKEWMNSGASTISVRGLWARESCWCSVGNLHTLGKSRPALNLSRCVSSPVQKVK